MPVEPATLWTRRWAEPFIAPIYNIYSCHLDNGTSMLRSLENVLKKSIFNRHIVYGTNMFISLACVKQIKSINSCHLVYGTNMLISLEYVKQKSNSNRHKVYGINMLLSLEYVKLQGIHCKTRVRRTIYHFAIRSDGGSQNWTFSVWSHKETHLHRGSYR